MFFKHTRCKGHKGGSWRLKITVFRKLNIRFRVGLLRSIHIPGFPVFFHECDGACRPEFAIQIRIAAFEAIWTEIDFVLHAHKIRFGFRVIDTLSHCLSLF